MKHNFFFYYLSISLLFTLLCACDKDEETNNRINFQESGFITVDFSYQEKDVDYKINIVNQSLETSTTQISLLTPKELADYNYSHKTNYHLMPEGTYELTETNITFSKGESSKKISIKIHPDKLFNIIRKDTENKLYTLPLKLGNQSFISSSNTVIYRMNMSYPQLCLTEETGIRLIKKESEVFLEAYTYEGDSPQPILNQEDINLQLIVPDNAEEWLQMYNDTSTTKYQLLPTGAYELSKMSGAKDDKKCSASIKIKRTLSSGDSYGYGNFILPIKLTGVDKHIALNHNISTLKVINSDNYNDVKREYDDGENIIFHVKLAIDKEGLEMMDNDMEFFREQLAIQWDEINRRFNGLDKKGVLKRNYIFVPDLEDIIVFDHEVSSNWDVALNYADRIDPSKVQLAVSYDFYKQEDEGGGGFGGKSQEGVDHIMVTCYSNNKDDIRKFAGIEGLSDESIVHELGHYRGLIDTYWCELNTSDNLITHQGFQPERGNMMGACYQPLENIEWSEYEMYVINATGCKNVNIHKKVAEYFPDDVEITVTENGQPAEGFILKFYPKDYNGSKIEKMSQSYTQNGSKITLNAKVPLFWPSQNWYDNYQWTYNRLLLAEATSQKSGKKGYIFIPVYEVHKQGLKDKLEQPITGRSIFKATIDIK